MSGDVMGQQCDRLVPIPDSHLHTNCPNAATSRVAAGLLYCDEHAADCVPYTCPQCGSGSVLRHLFVVTDRLCLDCGAEWSIAAQPPPHTDQTEAAQMTRRTGDRASHGWRSTIPEGSHQHRVIDCALTPDGETTETRTVCSTWDKAMADDCREWERKRKLREGKS